MSKSKKSNPKDRGRGYTDEVFGEVPDSMVSAYQKMMDAATRAHEDLKKIKVEGLGGGGLVRVRRAVLEEYTSVKIDESLLNESVKVVEDLVLAAIQDAAHKALEAQREFQFSNVHAQPITRLIHKLDA